MITNPFLRAFRRVVVVGDPIVATANLTCLACNLDRITILAWP